VLDEHRWAGLRWDRILASKWQLRLLFECVQVSLRDVVERAQDQDELVSGVVAAIGPGTCGEAVFRGFSLWELAKTGICGSLEKPCRPETLASERELRIVRHYYAFVCRMILGCERLLDEVSPSAVVVSQGASPMSRPLIEVARRRKINTVATENSFAGGYFFCDNATGIILNRHRAALVDGAWLEAVAFTREERAAFDAFLASAKAHKKAEHSTGTAAATGSVREQLGIGRGQRMAVFIGQVCTDASVVMDSKAFVDPVDLIERVWSFFRERPEWTLVVRLHPKECNGASWVNGGSLPGPPPGEPDGYLPYNCLTARRLAERSMVDGMDARLRIVADLSVDTQKLMGEAAVGITINSQAGFEMALMDRPVVVCGDAFYGRKGFTFDVSQAVALESVLTLACTDGCFTEDAAMRARRFGDWLFRSVLFPRSLQGAWRRLLRVVAPDVARGLDGWLLEKACQDLETSEAPDGWYAPSN
jgi:hypothetical protein